MNYIIKMDFDNYQYVELLLDTKDASQVNPNYLKTDWGIFYFTTPLENIVGFKIIQAEIPFSFYIVTTQNNTFTLQDSSGTYTIILPIGNYDAITLTTQLKDSLEFVSSLVYNVIFDTQTNKFTISTTGNFIFTFPPTNSANSLLGFGTGIYSSVSNVLVAPFVAEITGPNYIYVNSDYIGTFTNCYLPQGSVLTRGNNGPQVSKIPVTVNPGEIIYYDDPTPEYFFDMENIIQLSRLDFYLSLGPKNENIPLSLNGLSFSLKVALFIRRSIVKEATPKARGGVFM